jgi:hypothetical protein
MATVKLEMVRTKDGILLRDTCKYPVKTKCTLASVHDFTTHEIATERRRTSCGNPWMVFFQQSWDIEN